MKERGGERATGGDRSINYVFQKPAIIKTVTRGTESTETGSNTHTFNFNVKAFPSVGSGWAIDKDIGTICHSFSKQTKAVPYLIPCIKTELKI